MNRFLSAFNIMLLSLFITSCDKDEDYMDLPIESDPELVEKGDEVGIKISKYMNQASGGVSVQGADCYGDFLFQFQHANAAVYIYDLKKKEFVCKVELKSKSQNHCNNASFSRIFYEEGDEFPLLYVSGSQSGTYNQVQVYRIFHQDKSFSLEQVQEILLPLATSDNNLYWTGVILDNENEYMYIYANSNGAQIANMYIPDFHQKNVEMKDEDIIEQHTYAGFTHQQGAVINQNKLYIFDGVPGWGDTNFLRIIDLEKKEDVAKVNLTKLGFRAEAEGAFLYNGELYNATNNSGIFRFILK